VEKPTAGNQEWYGHGKLKRTYGSENGGERKEETVGGLVSQSVSQSASQSVNQPVSQSISQSVNQSVSQSSSWVLHIYVTGLYIVDPQGLATQGEMERDMEGEGEEASE